MPTELNEQLTRILGPLGSCPNRHKKACFEANWSNVIAVFFTLWVLLVISVESVNAVLDGSNYWSDFTHNFPEWCEAQDVDNSTLARFIIEPSNARSDYSYAGVGIGMIVIGAADAANNYRHRKQPHEGGKKIRNLLLEFPVITVTNGVLNVIHAFGTFFNHACECSEGGLWDVAGMLAVTSFPLIYTILQISSRIWPQLYSQTGAIAVAFMQTLVLIIVLATGGNGSVDAMFVVLPFTVVGCVCYAVYNHPRFKASRRNHLRSSAMFVSLAGFVIGWIAWNMDLQKTGCMPRSLIQGHAAWHVFTAFAIAAIYIYFRRERGHATEIPLVVQGAGPVSGGGNIQEAATSDQQCVPLNRIAAA